MARNAALGALPALVALAAPSRIDAVALAQDGTHACGEIKRIDELTPQ
jgi:hypothetical protein